ncbi:unnamed protein product [Paramecium sonneborni]|uniref:Uncharacterized protein n=1 Tax=Paramecium sonneborni TaxID=65129 RepID=A0A8S1KPN5_9CILI|nr:unnamed protein product [Paramecium sonneborni]
MLLVIIQGKINAIMNEQEDTNKALRQFDLGNLMEQDKQRG